MFRNILVGVDGSPPAERALSEAIDIARSSRARLTLIAAIAKPPGWIYTPMTACASRQLEIDFEREARETLCAAVDRVPLDTPVTKILSREPIRDALRRETDSGRYDLLVIGASSRHAPARRRGGVKRYVPGHCKLPVLIVGDERQPVPAPGEAPDAPPLGRRPIVAPS